MKLILKHFELEDGISYSAIEIILNPMRLLKGDDYVGLADNSHLKQIQAAFKQAFKPLKKKFESIKRNKGLIFRFDQLDLYNYKRVDFAINVYNEQIDLYMKLIR